MPVTYSNSVKHSRLQAVIDAIGNDGLIKIGTAGMTVVLAQVPLANPPFAAPAGGAMALAGTPRTDPSAAATDAAGAATITKSDGTIIASGLTVGVTGSGADIELASIAIQANQEVRLTGGGITHG